MRYGSVCSGIEAASVAWEPLGWQPQFFSEIEPFPSAVLAHRWPSVPNLGDMTKHKEWPDAAINVLVGGTPCQSFSVAGLRKGMADPRGNLALTYLAIADQYRPRWLVWENVPGVLSSNGGRDFGAFLGGLGKLGYGFAYRVLDAQYFGVAQRRRRVFVVGCLGDWRRAAAVLFERDSLSGNPAPSRGQGEEAAGTLASRTGAGGFPGTDEACSGYVQPVAFGWQNSPSQGDSVSELVTPTLDKSKTPAVAFVQNSRDEVRLMGGDGGIVGALAAQPGMKQTCYVAFQPGNLRRGAGAEPSESVFPTLKADHGRGVSDQFPHVADRLAVRRLTPVECERLQGFPDDHTATPYRNKPAADGPRYKAIGNSMAVPVMQWIGERIAMITAIKETA